ncbi:Zn(2)-C6 fungal-type domain-containing protein [Mycena kentingensis (nom. inval.)]|nr:Zn(2)-C6 fungal-type domain-containing protein [Mycena kentingensis (nom. inval.)]
MNAQTFHLDKGKACFNCRRRKVKCDARRPICTPCSKFLKGGLHDCEYTEMGPTTSQVLEEKISILQSRIQEMENPSQARTSIGLHNPYHPGHGRRISVDVGSKAPWVVPHLRYPGIPLVNTEWQVAKAGVGPQSANFARNLIASFVTHAASLGFFFLDPNLFNPLLQGQPGVLPTQLASPALLDAVCLWGAHLQTQGAPQRSPADTQCTLLTTAQRSASTALSLAHTPSTILHGLQAHVLLAIYLFRAGRGVEARYHAGIAASIALGAGLWRIRSGRSGLPNTANSIPGIGIGIDELTAPVNAADEGDRIDAFWAVAAVNACWSRFPNTHPAPQSIDYEIVDTPWPVERQMYSANSGVLPERKTRTIAKFLANQDRFDHNNALPALLNKAAVLYEQVVRVSTALQDAGPRYAPTISDLERQREADVLEQVVVSMRNVLQSGPPVSSSRALLAHSLVHGAGIAICQRSGPLDHSARGKCVDSALAIVKLVRDSAIVGGSPRYLDAILALLWTSACEEVFLFELGQPQTLNRVTIMREGVQLLVGALDVLVAQGCRLAETQAENIRTQMQRQ